MWHSTRAIILSRLSNTYSFLLQFKCGSNYTRHWTGGYEEVGATWATHSKAVQHTNTIKSISHHQHHDIIQRNEKHLPAFWNTSSGRCLFSYHQPKHYRATTIQPTNAVNQYNSGQSNQPIHPVWIHQRHFVYCLLGWWSGTSPPNDKHSSVIQK